ncbi:strictosidine synthase [Nocardia sp. NBC_01499]|uniref:strictosidine synthase n=1 Tax=Nocardia sp. NBC_01499 TaxID=2903597 RepID=UPI00386315C7
MSALYLLFLRRDLPRAESLAHWHGPHGSKVAAIPGIWEYRQHEFAVDSRGLWAPTPGVETAIDPQWRVDGTPEVTFGNIVGPVAGLPASVPVLLDEHNAFDRTLFYLTGPGGGRWLRDGLDDQSGARTVVLLRRRPGVAAQAFHAFLDDFGRRLAAIPDLAEIRTQEYLPWSALLWPSPGVAHDNPPERQYHASFVLGAIDRPTLVAALSAPTIRAAGYLQQQNCSAIHAYDVTRTSVKRRNDRPVPL